MPLSLVVSTGFVCQHGTQVVCIGLRVFEFKRMLQSLGRFARAALSMQIVSQIGMSCSKTRRGSDGGKVARFSRHMLTLAKQGIAGALLLLRRRIRLLVVGAPKPAL